MTVQHEQRYHSASDRNANNFLRHAPDFRAKHFSGMELPDLKHHLGVRQKDMGRDESLKSWLDKSKASAKKNDIKSTFKASGGHATSDVVEALIKTGIPAEQITAALVVHPKRVQVEAVATHDDAPAKKLNPKKAARQEALAKSGTASQGNKSQKVDADSKRAEFMASQKQREPRILVKR